jgi:hypothetical protein
VIAGCGSVAEPTGHDGEEDAGGDAGGGPCASDADCGDPVPGGWSACEAVDSCGTLGERARDVEQPRCDSGTCTSETTEEREVCDRVTEGVSCGADIPGDWSACGYPSQCAEEGSRERTVQIQVCRSGTCTLEDTVETKDCSRETDGQVCDDDDPCSPETHCTGGVCSGFICAPCPC